MLFEEVKVTQGDGESAETVDVMELECEKESTTSNSNNKVTPRM